MVEDNNRIWCCVYLFIVRDSAKVNELVHQDLTNNLLSFKNNKTDNFGLECNYCKLLNSANE
jgi:hypothetical protein